MSVQIAIANIQEDEFTLNESAIPQSEAQKMRFGIDFGFNVNEEKQLFEVKTLINLIDENQNNAEVMRFRTAVTYAINPLKDVYKKLDNGTFDLKNDLMHFLLQTNISTVRGMLFTHLKDTRLNRFVIPIFDMNQMMQNIRNKSQQQAAQQNHGIQGLK